MPSFAPASCWSMSLRLVETKPRTVAVTMLMLVVWATTYWLRAAKTPELLLAARASEDLSSVLPMCKATEAEENPSSPPSSSKGPELGERRRTFSTTSGETTDREITGTARPIDETTKPVGHEQAARSLVVDEQHENKNGVLPKSEDVLEAFGAKTKPAPPPRSDWTCVGGQNEILGHGGYTSRNEQRQCVFRNVCYDLQAEDFIFVGEPDRPTLYDRQYGIQRKFRFRREEGDPFFADFVSLQARTKFNPEKDPIRTWSFRDKLEAKPTSAFSDKPAVKKDIETSYYGKTKGRPRYPNSFAPRVEKKAGWKASYKEGEDVFLQLPGVHVLFDQADPFNLGHVLWEDMFGIYSALRTLDVLPMNEVLLQQENKSAAAPGDGASKTSASAVEDPRTHLLSFLHLQSCEEAAGFDAGRAKICHKFRHAFGAHLLAKSTTASTSRTTSSTGAAGGASEVVQPPSPPGGTMHNFTSSTGLRPGHFVDLTSLLATMEKQFIQAGPGTSSAPTGKNLRYICFENLVLPGRNGVFDSTELNAGKTSLLHEFRRSLLLWHQLDPNFVPEKPKVVLVEKHGKRGFHNFAQIAKAVRERGLELEKTLAFGGGSRAEEVQQSDSTPSLICRTSWRLPTFRAQLQLLLRTTVLITPSGGISTILPFLPKGSFVILPTYQAPVGFFARPFSSLMALLFRPWGHGAQVSQEENAKIRAFVQNGDHAEIAGAGGQERAATMLPRPTSTENDNFNALRSSSFWLKIQDKLRFGNHMGECLGCPNGMEDELWQHFPHVKKMRYQVFSWSEFENSEPGRDSAVILNPERLVPLLETALYSWRNSKNAKEKFAHAPEKKDDTRK
ncbi:unnamed protein product [Amoebophrya sp. A120]|nr:unnamed protein product [Amoebophrya sp. A120]|eukprot:GSA120T00023280001.1